MKWSRSLSAIVVSIGLTAGSAPAQDKAVHPKIQEMMGQVSEARIRAILEKLESFGTRHTTQCYAGARLAPATASRATPS